MTAFPTTNNPICPPEPIPGPSEPYGSGASPKNFDGNGTSQHYPWPWPLPPSPLPAFRHIPAYSFSGFSTLRMVGLELVLDCELLGVKTKLNPQVQIQTNLVYKKKIKTLTLETF